MSEKPTLGVKPAWLWREERMLALSEAISHYLTTDRTREVNVYHWACELQEHADWFMTHPLSKNCHEAEK